MPLLDLKTFSDCYRFGLSIYCQRGQIQRVIEIFVLLIEKFLCVKLLREQLYFIEKKLNSFLTLLFKLMLKIGNFNTIKNKQNKRVTNSENYRFPAHLEINVVSTWKILMRAKKINITP